MEVGVGNTSMNSGNVAIATRLMGALAVTQGVRADLSSSVLNPSHPKGKAYGQYDQ